MGWETRLYTSITFNRDTFNSKYEVEEALDSKKELLEVARQHLRNLAFMTEPKKFCEESETPTMYLEREVKEWIETLEDVSIDIYKLELLLDNWESSHNSDEKAISLIEYTGEKDKIGCRLTQGKDLTRKQIKDFYLGRLSFMDGDFIKTDSKDDNYEY